MATRCRMADTAPTARSTTGPYCHGTGRISWRGTTHSRSGSTSLTVGTAQPILHGAAATTGSGSKAARPSRSTCTTFPMRPSFGRVISPRYVQDSWTINRRLTLSIGAPRPARPRVGSGAVSKARHVRPGVSRELQRGGSAEHFQFLHAARACRVRCDRRWPFGDQRRLWNLRASPLDRG